MSTKIHWADSTINPIVGCSKTSAGCQNCYAEKMAVRLAHMGRQQYIDVISEDGFSKPFYMWNGTTAFVPSELEKPYKWKNPRSIFVSSMGDLFHKSVNDEYLNSIMEMTMCCPQHTFLLLTKRAERMFEYFRDFPYRLKNVIFGVSVEDQTTADARIPILLQIPAVKRFVSLEPMIGPVSLRWLAAFPENTPTTAEHPSGKTNHLDGLRRIDGIILGGESGSKARPLNPAWVRDVRDQCLAAGVPFMFKQDSAFVKGGYFVKDGFPILDGRTHTELAWEIRK